MEPNNLFYSNNAKVEVKLEFTTGLSDGLSETAWIGVYHPHSSNRNYEYFVSFDHTNKEVIGNTLTLKKFQLPYLPGIYELRFFPAGGSYDCLSKSKIFRVGPIVQLSFHDDPSNEEQLILNWEQKFGLVSINSGWVGIYKVSDQNLVSYQNINTSESGQFTFKKPRPPGKYLFCFYWEQIRVAESIIFEITGEDDLICTPQSDGRHVLVQPVIRKIAENNLHTTFPWIGVYVVGETNYKNYLDYKMIKSFTQKQMLMFGPFEYPEHSVEYEFRLFPSSWGGVFWGKEQFKPVVTKRVKLMKPTKHQQLQPGNPSVVVLPSISSSTTIPNNNQNSSEIEPPIHTIPGIIDDELSNSLDISLVHTVVNEKK